PRCEVWHESVPAIGLMLLLQRQPGSNTALPTVLPASWTTSALPLPSNGRVSSGESKFFTSMLATVTSSIGEAGRITPCEPLRRPARTYGGKEVGMTLRIWLPRLLLLGALALVLLGAVGCGGGSNY